MSFWKKLQHPILVLAPMADVTDPAFRRIIATYGKPDVMWTEFVSADGLFMGGYDSLIKDLAYSESERPIVAQFFTSRPDMMERAAQLAVELGFDGIDINMGCPDKSVEKQGAGAGLIKNPPLAVELIKAAQRGIEEYKNRKIEKLREENTSEKEIKEWQEKEIPVSVKTRIGYNKNELETWLPILLSAEPAAITVHARTRKEMSLVPARWEHIKRAVEIRDELKSKTLILGNGDVTDIEHGKRLCAETGADGAMLGRAIFGNPWLFASDRKSRTPEERLLVLVEHTKAFEELCAYKNFSVMKKHFKAYVNGWDGAKELRVRLMECNNAGEVEGVIREYLSSL